VSESDINGVQEIKISLGLTLTAVGNPMTEGKVSHKTLKTGEKAVPQPT
jgi:hypothetical protein